MDVEVRFAPLTILTRKGTFFTSDRASVHRDVPLAPVPDFNFKFQASQEQSLQSCRSVDDVFLEDLF